MPAQPIDGRSVARRIIQETKEARSALGRTPGLGVLLVGDDPASHLYVGLKEKACAEVGIMFEKRILPERADLAEVIKELFRLNNAKDIDAVLVQLPLPRHLKEDDVIGELDPAKDVDGFHPLTVEALLSGSPTVVPGLAAGILALLHEATTRLDGMRVLVIANSETFFAPIAHLLEREGAFPSFSLPDAPDVVESAQGSDAVIVAVGRPGFLKGSMLKPGAVVIDVGTTRRQGRVVGDADESVWDVASYVTPVPGGVGPVTVAMLLKNTVELARRREER